MVNSCILLEQSKMKYIIVMFVASLFVSCIADQEKKHVRRGNCVPHPFSSKLVCGRSQPTKRLQFSLQKSSTLDAVEQSDSYDFSPDYEVQMNKHKRLEQALRKRIAAYLSKQE